MDHNSELVRNNPLFSLTQESQEKCWDVPTEIVHSRKTIKISEKNASVTEGAVNNSNSHGKDDKESEDMAESTTSIRKLKEEEKDEQHGTYSKETGNLRLYSVNPVIIQAGGVASYHSVYSPYERRPRFRRYRSNRSAESEASNWTLGRYNPEIQRTQVETKAEIMEKGSSSKESAKCEPKEATSDPQPVQETTNVEETINEIMVRDGDHKEQPQPAAESDDNMEPKPNSSNRSCLQRSTVKFKFSKCMVYKTSLILVGMFFALATASNVIMQFNNNNGSTSAQGQNSTEDIIRLRDWGLNPPQQLERWANWFWKTVINSEYVTRLKDFSKKVVKSSSDAFSSFASRTGFMAMEITRKVVSLTRKLDGNFTSFPEDLTRSTAEELTKFNGSFESNKTMEPRCTCPGVIPFPASGSSLMDIDEVPEHDENEAKLSTENNSGEDIDLIEYIANSESDDRQEDDQMPTEQKSSLKEGLLNLSPEVMEVEKEHFNHQTLVVSNVDKSNSRSESATSGLKKYRGITWTFNTLKAPVLVILLVLIATISFYLWPFNSSKGQGMKRRKPRSRQIEAASSVALTPNESPQPFGSYVECVDLLSSQGSRSKEIRSTSICTPVRRSMRIRNKSLSPLTSPPIFRTPT